MFPPLLRALTLPRWIRLAVIGFAGALGVAAVPEGGPSLEAPESSSPRSPAPDAGVTGLGPFSEPSLDSKLDALDSATTPPVPSRLAAPPIAQARPLPKDKDLLAQAKRGKDGKWGLVRNGSIDVLTIDDALQSELQKILVTYDPPYAAVVALEPDTGRVLAMVEHSQADPTMRGLPVKAIFPAASVFKMVTSSALMGQGVNPDQEECFHGGKRRLSQKLLLDTERDGLCYSLSTAFAKSVNVIFAKQTLKHLSAKQLRDKAAQFGFNKPLQFEMPVEISLAAIPDDPFGLASAGAGFGDVYLSPLHGAALASVVANRGVWKSPVLLEKDVSTSGPGERVLPGDDAERLANMMELTVATGTARKVFRERGHRVPNACGKTGSLADRNPYRDYSWFVGFAPKDHPMIAVAAVIVNGYYWRIHSSFLAREAMRLYLEEPGRESVGTPPSAIPQEDLEPVSPSISGPAFLNAGEPPTR